MPTAGQICTHDVFTASRAERLLDAARRMRDRNVGCLVVVAPGEGARHQTLGILTERDIVLRALARSGHLEDATVADAMTTTTFVARETEDVCDVLKIMRDRGVRRLPVVGDYGQLVGIVTFDDLVARAAVDAASLSAMPPPAHRCKAGSPT